MADNKGRGDSADDNGNGDDDDEDGADLEAQIKALTAKKQAADARAAKKREAMGEDDFAASKPGEPGKFDGEVREPGWRWDRSRNDWTEHRGTDFTKRSRATLPHNREHLGDGSPQNPHRIEQVQRWM